MVKPVAKLFRDPAKNIMAEIGKTAALMKNVIDLSIGDPDMDTPRPIVNATTQAMLEGNTHYTASDGDPRYLQTIVNFHNQHFGSNYGLDNVRTTVGASHATDLAFGALLDPEDEVIIFEPYFAPYKVQVEQFHGKPVFVTCKAENNFQPQKEDIEAAITPKTKVILVNSPNNPTGAVYDQKVLQDIVTLAEKYDLYLIADEVYWPYVFNERTFIPLENLAPKRTIVTGSLSKVFAMTGFRIGYMLAPKELITAAGLLNEGVTYTAPSMAQVAGTYGLQNVHELAAPLQDEFGKRPIYLSKELNKLSWAKTIPVAGSIYLFLDITGSGMDDIEFSDYLLEQAGILVIPGQAFGQGGRGFVRIAATQNMETLKKAVVGFNALSFADQQAVK